MASIVTAQEGDPKPTPTVGIETVVVTVRRQAEDVQTVPISVSVIRPRDLQSISPASSNADTARLTPNFMLNESGGPYSNIGRIRGVGSLFTLSPDDTSVSFNIDEIPMSAFGLPPSTLDLERIEVLRGPQGTLYGRNSQAGAVNFIPNRPEFAPLFILRGEIGAHGWRLGEIVANTPLINNVLSGRIGLQYSHRGGDISNVIQGGNDGKIKVGAVRGSLLWTPKPNTVVLLTLNYNRNDDTLPIWVLRDANCYPCSGLNPRNDITREMSGFTFRIEHHFDDLQLTSLSSLHKSKSGQLFDLSDGLVFGALGFPPERLNNYGEDFSRSHLREQNVFQEFRVSSLANSPINWTGGANYFRSKFDRVSRGENITLPSFGVYSGELTSDLKADSYAAFGEVSLPIAKSIRLSGGARLTHEDKSVVYRYRGSGVQGTVNRYEQQSVFTDTYVTGRLGLSYQFNDKLMTFVTIGRGAVAGGFPWTPYNVPVGANDWMFPTSFSWTYEAGFKSTGWSRLVTFNGSAFYNDVRDGHLLAFDPSVFAFTIAVLDYRTFGGELETHIQPTRNLTFFGSLGYTDAAFREMPEPNLTGARTGGRVPGVAGLTGYFGADYAFSAKRFGLGESQFYISANYQYVGARTVDVQRSFDLKSYGVSNNRIGWKGGRTEIYAFANNVFDRRYQIIGGTYGPGGELVRPSLGRTVGLGTSWRF